MAETGSTRIGLDSPSADGILALPRCFSTPAGIGLGALDDIADGGARAFVLKLAQARFHGFVVRQGADCVAYVDRCPHAGVPLSKSLDAYLTSDGALIACSWHGALFEIDSGLCVGGPCQRAHLTRWPVEVHNGRLVTA
ncbi:Rieske (2Fe-2S) protein [soil metagenome]